MTEIKIRSAELADYEAIHKVWTSPIVMRETLGIPYVSLDATRKQLENLPPIEQLLVAEVDGQVVGILGLHVRRNRMSHMAGLGIGVRDDHQDSGIGTRLMEAALELAFKWLNLRRIELHVYTDNTRAIHLYEKFGFSIEGTHKAFAFRDGAYVDAYSMALLRED